MIDTADILRKAASEVESSGMWCAGAMFANRRDDEASYRGTGWSTVTDLDQAAYDDLAGKYRCAQGSIHLASLQLGGGWEETRKAIGAVEIALGRTLFGFNDIDLSINRQADPFTAGQALAEVFRQTADSL